MSDDTVGVYVHVPFCERICPYCDFAVVRARTLAPERERAFVAALRAELARRSGAFAGRALASVYLGGGTPSLLRPESVAELVEAVRAAFPAPLPPGAEPGAAGPLPEVTLEVNPSTVERARLPGFREAGVTRVSLGVQSFDDAVLKRLGRAHRAEEARATLAACREAGFASLSLDWIYGVPGQDDAALARDLAAFREADPEHVSAYELTVEPGTPYARAVARGQLVPPDEEAVLRMAEAIEAGLAGAGLARYEISSYARPGHEAVHNRRYWARRPVLGIGVGAWSSDPPAPGAPHGRRRHNVRDLETWLARVEAGASPEAGPAETLDPPTARGEAVFLALRTRRGLDAAGFAREFGAPPRGFYAAEIDALRALGLLAEAPDGSLRLTPRGERLADSVAAHFVAGGGGTEATGAAR